MADLARAAAVCEALGEIFCLTFVKGADAAGALRRIGAYPDTVAPRTGARVWDLTEDFDAGYPQMAAAIGLGAWSVVIEPQGFAGSSLVAEMSRGTEAVSVLRHDYAAPQVAYAVDGTLVAGFDPDVPAAERMWGSAPEVLHPAMRDAGLLPPPENWEPPHPRTVLLAERLTGTTLPADPLEGAVLSAEIEPWFVAGTADVLVPRSDPALVAAAGATDPRRQRAMAVAELRRLADLLGIAGTPGLAEVLDAAAAGAPPAITAASPLGGHVREWLARERRASDSLNSRQRHRLTDAERTEGYRYGWFTAALRGVLDPDPRRALLSALRPVGSVPELFGGPAARTALLDALTGAPGM